MQILKFKSSKIYCISRIDATFIQSAAVYKSIVNFYWLFFCFVFYSVFVFKLYYSNLDVNCVKLENWKHLIGIQFVFANHLNADLFIFGYHLQKLGI